jgi:NAD(P)-dependent dehydrogenase (short-subunit alcohol dehydrogenase family)
MAEFNGKTALVTGAGSGIGRATALAFAKYGARVVVADLNQAGGRETVEMIHERFHGEAAFIGVDISDPGQVQAMLAETVQTFGSLHYACNNAGVAGEQGTTADYSLDDWRRVIDTNLTGTWLCMKYELPEILKAGGGAIVNVSSILGQSGFANAPAYTASKHGILGLTKTAALEYATQNVRINAVCPAVIETPMIGPIREDAEMLAAMKAMHPINRLGQPEEVAEAIVWLCADESSFVVGEALLVDGGYTAR